MSKVLSKSYKLIIIVIDLILINLSYLTAFFLKFGFDIPMFNLQPYLNAMPFITVAALIAYTGLSGRQFRRHPDIKPETSGHLIDQLDFTLKLIVVQCFSYHHKSVNLISLIVFSAITSRMDFFESRARIYVL